jgi:dCTP deaminase
MILGSEQILARIQKDTADPLVITPLFEAEKLREKPSSSVDLRLGAWFSTMVQHRLAFLDVNASGEKVQSGSSKGGALTKLHYVPFGGTFILHPGSFVLGVTLEWLRLPSDLAAYVIGKSSWGRRGLIIATAVGVHPGFTGCLTLELSNVGEIPILVKPGMLICQLFIHQVDSDSTPAAPSSFACSRKPSLGDISPDRVAKKLAAEKL